MTLRQEVGEYAAIILALGLRNVAVHVSGHDHQMSEGAGGHGSGPGSLDERVGDGAEVVVHGDLDQVTREDGTAGHHNLRSLHWIGGMNSIAVKHSHQGPCWL